MCKIDAAELEVEEGNIFISICIPVYNVADYLPYCLESIYAQRYSSFEVIMVDDGSTDQSGLICDQYADLYPNNTRVIHKVNEGPLLARRDGIGLACGSYVVCIDSDDALMPGALATIDLIARTTHADVIQYGYTRDCDLACDYQIDSVLDLCNIQQKSQMLNLLCCSTDGSLNPMWLKAVKLSCIGAEVDYSDFKGMRFAEDFLQTLAVFDRAECFCTTELPLYYYRPGSGITSTYSPKFYYDVVRSLDVAEGYARTWEKRYECEGLTAGISSCRLDSLAQYAEWLAMQGDLDTLEKLRESSSFKSSVAIASMDLLRFDRRFTIKCLERGAFTSIALLGRAKRLYNFRNYR